MTVLVHMHMTAAGKYCINITVFAEGGNNVNWFNGIPFFGADESSNKRFHSDDEALLAESGTRLYNNKKHEISGNVFPNLNRHEFPPDQRRYFNESIYMY